MSIDKQTRKKISNVKSLIQLAINKIGLQGSCLFLDEKEARHIQGDTTGWMNSYYSTLTGMNSWCERNAEISEKLEINVDLNPKEVLLNILSELHKVKFHVKDVQKNIEHAAFGEILHNIEQAEVCFLKCIENIDEIKSSEAQFKFGGTLLENCSLFFKDIEDDIKMMERYY